jgi:prolyl oligopeptidase PreP (S9A serine peptidase family)
LIVAHHLLDAGQSSWLKELADARAAQSGETYVCSKLHGGGEFGAGHEPGGRFSNVPGVV